VGKKKLLASPRFLGPGREVVMIVEVKHLDIEQERLQAMYTRAMLR
jgi:hypothetical protein